MKRPVGYLRKSRVTSDRHVSWQTQEREIRALAERNGDGDLELLSDWGKSGRGERTRHRTEYLRLRDMIAADEVSVLYSYSLSRVARSLAEYASLAELCRDHGVRVRLCKEGEFDYSSASGRFTVGILALLAQMEAELAQERARDTIATRKARGDHVGSAGYGKRLNGGKLEDAPGEDIETIAAAFREAGSYSGAAKILNAAGVPTKTGRGEWAQTSVARVLRRARIAPPPRAEQAGARMRGNFTLSRLLVCPCGGVLTGRKTSHTTKYGSYGPYVSYQCFRGRYVADHPRPFMVSESVILPWVQREAARFNIPGDALERSTGNEMKRAELEDQKRAVGDALVVGAYTREQAAAKIAAIEAQIDALEDVASLVDVPQAIEWDTWPAADINAHLRALWDRIKLDEAMRPVRADWRLPAEYVR